MFLIDPPSTLPLPQNPSDCVVCKVTRDRLFKAILANSHHPAPAGRHVHQLDGNRSVNYNASRFHAQQ